MKILTIVGARPQFIKAGVISNVVESSFGEGLGLEEVLVHTGQHYDEMLSDVFFNDLGIPEPKYNLGIGSNTPSTQLGGMMKELESVLEVEEPDCVLLYGDTNSSLAGALSATFLNIPVVHVEAGERIYRRNKVPEEINRILIDNISSLCLTSTKRAKQYLMREGFAPQRVQFVGDPMYDLFKWVVNRLGEQAKITYSDFGLSEDNYHLATIHRAQNTDSEANLFCILEALDEAKYPVLLPVHPRVRKILDRTSYSPTNNLILIEALGYFDFISLLVNCRKVVTDSGGVTREAFFAGKPCIIPMENSWWTEVVENGWALSIATNKIKIKDAIDNFTPPNRYPDGLFGDGKSGEKIVEIICSFFSESSIEGHWHSHGRFTELPQARFSEFTHSNYNDFLEQLKNNGYVFSRFDHAENQLLQQKPFVLMRHDIDMSLENAVDMAKIEYEQGIRATYFLMVRNELYNIFSEKGTQAINEILDYGHFLGLHFDCSAYPKDYSIEEYNHACHKEVQLLENWFNSQVSAVSYHRPDDMILSGEPELSKPLPHTYESLFTEEIAYFSDSRGEWRHGHPLDSESFNNKEPLHILVHPIWWKRLGTYSYEVLLQLVEDKKMQIETYIAENNEVFRVGNFKHLNN